MKHLIKIFMFALVITVTAVSISSAESFATTKKVATLYLVTAKNVGASSTKTPAPSSIDGHAFIAVKNNSSKSIKVGHYNLSSKAFVTVGTWGNLSDGKKIYYNVEKYRMINTKCKYKPNIYLKKELTKAELSKLTKAINGNNFWKASKNCARFARYSWNSVLGRWSTLKIGASKAVETPKSLHNKMNKTRKTKKNFEFGAKRKCPMSKVYRHTKKGKVKLSDKTKKEVKGI